jgi:hypothetical protein
LLLKSKLQEVIKERDTYKHLNHDLTSKITSYENGIQTHSVNQMNFSNANLNYNYGLKDTNASEKNGINSITNASDSMYDYLSEFNLNEMIYILIKNFEANKFDVNIIEERVLKDSNSKSLFEILNNSNEKEFSEKLTNNILNLLKV